MKASAKYFRVAVDPRSGTSSQKWLKTYLMTSRTKKTQNQKVFFFIVDSKTCQVFWGFEH